MSSISGEECFDAHGPGGEGPARVGKHIATARRPGKHIATGRTTEV